MTSQTINEKNKEAMKKISKNQSLMWFKYAKDWLKHQIKQIDLKELKNFEDYENYCHMLAPRILE
jgi:hypothetical protein